MTSHLARAVRLATASALAFALLATAPLQASASPDTIRRSFSNIILSPLDILLSPVVAGKTLVTNMRDIDDPTAVRVIFAAPGYVWFTGLQVGAGAIRGLCGLLELPPGILLFPFEADLDPLYSPVDRAPALLEIENPLVGVESPWVYYNPLVAPFAIPVKFGINYTTSD